MSISMTLFADSAFAQSAATQPDSLENEVQALREENAAVRELVRKMEEQQKALLDQVDRLQRRLESVTTAVEDRASAGLRASRLHQRKQRTVEPQKKDDHYQDGIVIWQNPEDARVPFLLRFNNNTQLRYLNTLDSKDTFTDHLGVVRDVHRRNDITVNRSMFILAATCSTRSCNTA
jgi:hypothetical protein